jgi:hypothetical protein
MTIHGTKRPQLSILKALLVLDTQSAVTPMSAKFGTISTQLKITSTLSLL